MLSHLRVSNLGVLGEAAIDPAEGLTVITGETGAGKTLLLGGLRLMLGGRADSSVVGPASDQAQSDGLFSIGDRELGVTRVVPKNGRSRAQLNGSIVPAATLAEEIGSMVEIVGQHDHVGLRRRSRVLSLVDAALDEEGGARLAAYREAWDQLQQVLRRRAELGGSEMALRQELDLVRFQATEIDAASLEPGEDEQLEAEASRHANLDEIRQLLTETLELADVMLDQGGEVVSRMRKLAALDSSGQGLAGQSEEMAALLSELARGAREAGDALDLDPRRSEEVTERLNAIGDLKRKYGPTLEDVIEFGRQASRRAAELDDLLTAADRIDSDLENASRKVDEAASRLTQSRSGAANRIVEEARSHLTDLGLGRARLEVDVRSTEPNRTGADQIDLLFSSDAGLDLGPISAVASGGELSRLVLALRLATRSAESETLVFDEVDAGVGGVTALAMGRKLAKLARGNQVLCVTHLPQLAAFADAHFVVERHDGAATVRQVSGDERLHEISRMLAGLPDSEAGQVAAAELLSTASG